MSRSQTLLYVEYYCLLATNFANTVQNIGLPPFALFHKSKKQQSAKKFQLHHQEFAHLES